MSISLSGTRISAKRICFPIAGMLMLQGWTPSAIADGNHSAAVTVSYTIERHYRHHHYHRFLGADNKSGGWTGSAMFDSEAFPTDDIGSVTITPILAASDTVFIAPDRLWVKTGGPGAEYVRLDEIPGMALANPRARGELAPPVVEYRPTWRDAPGKHFARLLLTANTSVADADTTADRICDFEADVPPFLSFEVENPVVRLVSSATAGEMRGAQDIRVRVTTNSGRWSLKLSGTQSGQVCPTRFELVSPPGNRLAGVAGYSAKTGMLSGNGAVNEKLLTFRLFYPANGANSGQIQVCVEGRAGG